METPVKDKEASVGLSGSNVGLSGFYPPTCGISRAEWHDKAWALFHAKTFGDTMLHKVNIHTMRAVFDATYDALFVPPNAKLTSGALDAPETE